MTDSPPAMRPGPQRKARQGPPPPSVRSQTASESSYLGDKYDIHGDVEEILAPVQFEQRRDGTFVQVDAAQYPDEQPFLPQRAQQYPEIQAPMFPDNPVDNGGIFASNRPWPSPLGYTASEQRYLDQRNERERYERERYLRDQKYRQALSATEQPNIRFTITNPNPSLAALAPPPPPPLPHRINLSLEELLQNI